MKWYQKAIRKLAEATNTPLNYTSPIPEGEVLTTTTTHPVEEIRVRKVVPRGTPVNFAMEGLAYEVGTLALNKARMETDHVDSMGNTIYSASIFIVNKGEY